MVKWTSLVLGAVVMGGVTIGCGSSTPGAKKGSGGAGSGGSGAGGSASGGSASGGSASGGSASGGSASGGSASGGSGPGGSGAGGQATWSLTSTAFAAGAAMPAEYTCNGAEFASGGNPALEWTAGPAATKSYAIVLKDLSVLAKNDPATIGRAFHWVIWDIPTSGPRKIPTGMGDSEFPPEVLGARQWANRNQFGYFPPCPNSDPAADPATHVTDNYSFTLYAFDKAILDYPAMDPAVTNYSRTIHDYIESVAIAKTELAFTSNAASNAAPPRVDPATIKYPSARMALTSTAFAAGDAMPAEYTCNGAEFASGGNPALEWTAGPAATKSYAVVLKDLSVLAKNDPATIGRAFHWVIWDIPTDIPLKIPTGMGDSEFPPEVLGARQWANRNQFGYFPPCPNSDPAADPATHVTDNYSFTLYAFDKAILDYPAMDPAVTNYSRTIHDYIESVAIAKAELAFTSKAASNAAPPRVDPATIKYPSARP